MKRLLVWLVKGLLLLLTAGVVYVLSIYFTVGFLVRGEVVEAPDFRGKTLSEVKLLTQKRGFKLKTIKVSYDKTNLPNTVITQTPNPGIKVREGAVMKVFVNAEVKKTVMPELIGHNLKQAQEILDKNSLRRGHIAYMHSDIVPADFVISQSAKPGISVMAEQGIDLLLSKGAAPKAYIMPDLIYKRREYVENFFMQWGLTVSKVKVVPYQGLEPGIVIKQKPLPGHSITNKNILEIEVSE